MMKPDKLIGLVIEVALKMAQILLKVSISNDI